jgi:hypothetical protein
VGREAVAILSHGWRARYRGDRDVVGKTIVLDDGRYTVVGVMPAGSRFRARQRRLGSTGLTGADRQNRSGKSLAAMAASGTASTSTSRAGKWTRSWEPWRSSHRRRIVIGASGCERPVRRSSATPDLC